MHAGILRPVLHLQHTQTAQTHKLCQLTHVLSIIAKDWGGEYCLMATASTCPLPPCVCCPACTQPSHNITALLSCPGAVLAVSLTEL